MVGKGVMTRAIHGVFACRRRMRNSHVISVTEVSDKAEKKFTKRYPLTGNKVRMESFRRRLFKFLQGLLYLQCALRDPISNCAGLVLFCGATPRI